MTTYTPQGGNTPQAIQTNNAQANTQSMGPIPTSAGLTTQAAQMQAALPLWSANDAKTTQNAFGIPQASDQYSKLYQMFLADNQMSGQYLNPQVNTTGSTVQQASDMPTAPGLANPALPVLTPELMAKGFQGFTDPGMGVQAKSMDLKGLSGIMDVLQTLINTNTQRADASYQTDVQGQNAKIQALLTLAGYASQKEQAAASLIQSGGALGSIQQAGAEYDDIITKLQKEKGDTVTETDISNYINQHDSALRAQGVNVDELWKLQKDQASKVNKEQGLTSGGLIAGGKTSVQRAKDKANMVTAVSGLKGFGDFASLYIKNLTKLGPVGLLTNIDAIKGVEAEKKVYTGKLQKTLGIGRGKYNFEQLMQSLPGVVSVGYEGALRSHLTQLLDNNDLFLIRDNSGRTGVTNSSNFDPNIDTKIDPQSENFDTLIGIVQGL